MNILAGWTQLTNEKERFWSLQRRVEVPLLFRSLVPGKLNRGGIRGEIECWWTRLVLPHPAADADRVHCSDGNCPRSVPSQRSGSHACPRWIPLRLPCCGLRILGLAYPAASHKHPAARCCHLAAVQWLQVPGPPEEQRELLRRGGCFAGGTLKRIFHSSGELSRVFGDLSNGRWDDWQLENQWALACCR